MSDGRQLELELGIDDAQTARAGPRRVARMQRAEAEPMELELVDVVMADDLDDETSTAPSIGRRGPLQDSEAGSCSESRRPVHTRRQPRPDPATPGETARRRTRSPPAIGGIR